MKCESCIYLRTYTLSHDEVGGGMGSAHCAQQHWEGGFDPNEGDRDPWVQCKDYEFAKFYCDNNRHLICIPYSIENLHKMAQELGIDKCWFHSKPKKKLCHYDIPKERIKEIKSKCTIVPYKGIVKLIRYGRL